MHRSSAIRGAAVAELAVAVPSPALHAAIDHRATVSASSRKCRDVCVRVISDDAQTDCRGEGASGVIRGRNIEGEYTGLGWRAGNSQYTAAVMHRRETRGQPRCAGAGQRQC